ncbi:lipopolysaccharide/colanic/teichoic acid biosynthesis glycosyltransferase [Rhodobacter aestuarii]|uniref:Sugar transferase involved in LPS biosynthesis (Colanic, teichoic acid) n=2 Tax=Rhodobacter group TaxID=3374108 RepID=A0A1N7MTL7_9RHOB|nr:lipopolysaccharide/colanic/teichoic acid biosynthesis glycosyltransferase [Rhodobacter aestuarii]SIS89311.1 Sugar transferase involved in LPS biosynthesis (colanic, teichoic acid) [Rhodobacter aestuarii]SOB91569.1 lipopolysaccharide/colanic/teichoic acid biosynthesis glycosyltransferase [Rhodobacter sp. JA431]
MLAPLLLGCAAAIKLTSPGPVFFRQNRYGRKGTPFQIYKFRTMRTELSDSSGVQQTVKGDPRITPVGAFLRRTSIDELPQLLNVLEGTMSIVGPRPHVPNMIAAGVRYEDFDHRYMRRHAVLPGITGLAQVRGYRGETDTYEAARGRLDHDLEYLRTASFWGDLKIVFGTLSKEFGRGSGY